jgi:hypothetical protein
MGMEKHKTQVSHNLRKEEDGKSNGVVKWNSVWIPVFTLVADSQMLISCPP